jgi:hypothetical protein
MRITNRTDLPLSLIRDVLMFAAPSGVSNYDCEITFYRGYGHLRGRAWPQRNRVLLRIARPQHFPSLRVPPWKGYLGQPPLMDHVEALLFVAAHELRHLWQARIPRGYRVWGARGQYSERDADAYAWGRVRAWRRLGAVALGEKKVARAS